MQHRAVRCNASFPYHIIAVDQEKRPKLGRPAIRILLMASTSRRVRLFGCDAVPYRRYRVTAREVSAPSPSPSPSHNRSSSRHSCARSRNCERSTEHPEVQVSVRLGFINHHFSEEDSRIRLSASADRIAPDGIACQDPCPTRLDRQLLQLHRRVQVRDCSVSARPVQTARRLRLQYQHRPPQPARHRRHRLHLRLLRPRRPSPSPVPSPAAPAVATPPSSQDALQWRRPIPAAPALHLLHSRKRPQGTLSRLPGFRRRPGLARSIVRPDTP